MKKSSFFSSIVTSVALVSCLSPNTLAQSKNTYSCINYKGKPTTVVDTSRGKIQLIVWESDYFQNSGWTPNKRCQEVTQRFQEFSDKGILKYVTTGQINSYPVICVGTQVPGGGYQCQKDGLLITLQKNDNPNKVLENLFTNAAKVGGTPVTREPTGKYIFPMSNFIKNAPIMTETDIADIKVEETEVTTEVTSESKAIKSEPPLIECSPLLCD
ncbi:COP23 domain-containing protein [Cyanobacterium aponinum]|uniref:Uncharacterized protein n=1 Tax=Cyanobacterium aponinum (strain PCC 10605) TaxID=755178 RepID=K9Z5G7_CYAAP|nr:COP23 domain-containing protein [Cyanobacterium aponinum]AFZ54431.1 hypothetical protein Cyan10605_2347 [Cyanobacterium aponinum PCC 10605]